MEQQVGLYAFQLLLQKLNISTTRESENPFMLINISTGKHLQLDASATYALGVFDAGVDGFFFFLFFFL